MTVEDYGLGQEGNLDTACYWLEFKTRTFCSMSGGSAAKHLIFFPRQDGNWRYPRGSGSVDNAWTDVRAGFVEMLDLATEGRYDEVDDIAVLSGSAALRSKTLIMYFPDELLHVTSISHLEHFLRAVGVQSPESAARNRRRQP